MFGLDSLQRMIVKANQEGKMRTAIAEDVVPHSHLIGEELQKEIDNTVYTQREDIFKMLRTHIPDHRVLAVNVKYKQTDNGTFITTEVQYV
jgi:hypothetical protein